MSKVTRFQKYLAENGYTQARFAELLGVAQGTISKLCAGRTGLSRANADALKALTGGQIHAGNFDELVEHSPEPGSCHAAGVTEPAFGPSREARQEGQQT